jgi:hypothetical protein
MSSTITACLASSISLRKGLERDPRRPQTIPDRFGDLRGRKGALELVGRDEDAHVTRPQGVHARDGIDHRRRACRGRRLASTYGYLESAGIAQATVANPE